MDELCFEQVGGRCKLVSADSFITHLTNVPNNRRMSSLRGQWLKHQQNLREQDRVWQALRTS